MIYKILFHTAAEREFNKLTKATQIQLAQVIDNLSENPRCFGTEKLSGIDAYKIRSGNYRIIYCIIDDQLMVLIIRIADRKEVYKNLSIIQKRKKEK